MRSSHASLFVCVSVLCALAWPAHSLAAGGHASGGDWNVKLLAAPGTTGELAPLRFQLRNGESKTPTAKFEPAHERLLHAWLIRDTPSGGFADFQHVHPTLSSGGTWELADARMSKPGTWNLVVDATADGTQRYGYSSFDIAGENTLTQGSQSDYRAQISDLREHDGAWMATVDVRDTEGEPVDSTEPHVGAAAHWPMFVRTSAGDVQVVHAHASKPISDTGQFEFMFELPDGAAPEQVMDGWLEFRATGDDPQIMPLAPGAPAYFGSNNLIAAVSEMLRSVLPRIPVEPGAADAQAPATSTQSSGGHHG